MVCVSMGPAIARKATTGQTAQNGFVRGIALVVAFVTMVNVFASTHGQELHAIPKFARLLVIMDFALMASVAVLMVTQGNLAAFPHVSTIALVTAFVKTAFVSATTITLVSVAAGSGAPRVARAMGPV